MTLTVMLGVSRLGAQNVASCGQITYEHRNPVDYILRVGVVEGSARDDQGVSIPSACIGLFSEPDHKLLAATHTDAQGAFKFPPRAKGRYRLVAKYDGLCPANVILLVQPMARKVLRIHLKGVGIDTSSYVD